MERLRNTVTPMKITLPNKIEDLENPTTNLERPQPIKAEGSKILNKYKPKKIQKIVSGVKYDFQTGIKRYKKLGKLIWGDGDLRYLIKK